MGRHECTVPAGANARGPGSWPKRAPLLLLARPAWLAAVIALGLLPGMTGSLLPTIARAGGLEGQDSAPQFRDVEGRAHTPLSRPGGKATVLFFLLPDCPVSNYYAPEIARICKEYEPRKVAAFVVHADPDVSAEDARMHAREYDLTCPVLRDPGHVLVKRAGATMAPEAAVLLPDGTVAYRGRIDDTYADYGKRRAAPTRRDLRDALDAALAGKRVPAPTTEVIGCFLPEPAK